MRGEIWGKKLEILAKIPWAFGDYHIRNGLSLQPLFHRRVKWRRKNAVNYTDRKDRIRSVRISGLLEKVLRLLSPSLWAPLDFVYSII